MTNETKVLDYTGWKKIKPAAEEWVSIYQDKISPIPLKENEYLLVYTDEDGAEVLTSTYCCENGVLRKVSRGSIKAAKATKNKGLAENVGDQKRNTKGRKTTKSADGNSTGSKEKTSIIYPRNDEQVCAFDLMQDHSKTVKLLTGTWGSGKTLILVEAALQALRQGEFEKIIWIRNNVDVKDTKDLGALPGDVWEKLKPFIGPFIDHAGEEEVKTMVAKGSLVIEPLQTLRGRNFDNTLIMCSEAENLTKEHIQLIIARAAAGSEVWFDADSRQRDKVAFEKSQGVEKTIEKFAGHHLFGYVHLIKSERSETAAMADLLND